MKGIQRQIREAFFCCSALLNLDEEVRFGDEAHLNRVAVEQLAVESLDNASSASKVFRAELDPDVPVRVLLDKNVVNLTEVVAHAGDLVLDVHKERWIFLQVYLRRIEHANEENAGTRF